MNMGRFLSRSSSHFSHRQLKDASNFFFLIATCLAILTTFFVSIYMSTNTKSLINHHPHLASHRLDEDDDEHHVPIFSTPQSLIKSYSSLVKIEVDGQQHNIYSFHSSPSDDDRLDSQEGPRGKGDDGETPKTEIVDEVIEDHGHNDVNSKDLFHDKDIFLEDYKEMNRSLKIYVYPHKKRDPFANVFLPMDDDPSGNYASESYFKKALFESQFITNDPSEADLFYLPFSIASMRNDRRVGVGGIPKFIKNYIHNISHNFPYWNRTNGADHFYVACHSIGRTAMEQAIHVRFNAIQIVCSSSYFLQGYVAHKDASIPQIWPRKGDRPLRPPSQREKLAFYAGAMNSRVREQLVQVWKNDTNISVHQKRLKTPYSEALLSSKYCIHAKGFEVNTARIGDAIYYGCVPVVLADHYDLPYSDILNWKSFSVVVSTLDIPMLKKILQDISYEEYLRLQENVVKVQQHFQWNNVARDFDVFHFVLYELWLRRSHVRVEFNFAVL
ncbi:hypothetical protein Leryth_002412 [Lithospermum erythrorhizon]|nr:hypothetical protein Leryth_002412 [Lithospermum erythrorhizon]